MRSARQVSFSIAAVLTSLLSPGNASADKTPSQCGLPGTLHYSNVVIESCFNPGFDVVDVWIDPSEDLLHVSQYYDDVAYERSISTYDISNPEIPVLIRVVDAPLADPGENPASYVGITAGDGMLFAGTNCNHQAALCQSTYSRVSGWDLCAPPQSLPTLLLPGSSWESSIAGFGVHNVSYYGTEGAVFGANNLFYDDAFAIPVWDTGWSCPIDLADEPTLIPVSGLTDGEGGSQIHEVAALNYKLGVAAWTDVILFDLLTWPTVTELARTPGTSVHSVWPFAEGDSLVTEERLGGRLLYYQYWNNSLTLRDIRSIPSVRGASYHEVVLSGSHAYASAYQAGVRVLQRDRQSFDLLLSAYIDTASDSCAAPCGAASFWPGTWAISAGSRANGRTVFAASNNLSTGVEERVFLLSTLAPGLCGDGFTCRWGSTTVRRRGAIRDLVVARSSDNGVTFAGGLVAFLGGVGLPVQLAQNGLSHNHAYGTAIASGDFDGDGTNDIAVGAPGQVVGGVNPGPGAVYVYDTVTSILVQSQILDQTGLGTNAAGEGFGTALASGDFDRDGITDLAVGAPRAVEGNLVGAGSVFLFRGSAGGLVPWTTISNNSAANPQDAFGSALAAADFHGDLITDLVIGAPKGRVSATSPLSGVIYLYKGKINAIPVASGKKSQTGLDTDELEDRFGAALAAGDFNNDGRSDLAVGAPGERISDTGSGKAYVFLGNLTSTLTPSTSLTQAGIETDEEEDLFGARLVVSDFTGDGLADLAVSAPGEHTATGVRPGRVYVFSRTGTGFAPAASLDQAGLDTNEDLDGFGWASAAADWSGDGKSDLALFSTGLFEGANGTEPLFLFKGTATGATTWQTLTVP